MNHNTSGKPSPTAPLLPSIGRTGRDITPSRLSATFIGLSPTLQVKLLCKRGTIRLCHRSLSHIEMEPIPGSGFPPLIERKDRKAPGRLLLSLCQRPDYTTKEASFTRRNHVIETGKKGPVKLKLHSAAWKQN